MGCKGDSFTCECRGGGRRVRGTFQLHPQCFYFILVLLFAEFEGHTRECIVNAYMYFMWRDWTATCQWSVRGVILEGRWPFSLFLPTPVSIPFLKTKLGNVLEKFPTDTQLLPRPQMLRDELICDKLTSKQAPSRETGSQPLTNSRHTS